LFSYHYVHRDQKRCMRCSAIDLIKCFWGY